ncbi:MurT ligase domain-containing protein [Nonomuraea sp. NPDC050691]|uniref:MurT ligase domain-containing protein n=1 Tax=Nonomuraea sp. NPDC050691 TaxID=3155661 RepID=UPI0034035A45
MRLRLAVYAGRALAWYYRRTAKPGSGAIAGRVVLALAPGALRTLAAGRKVVVVSGTNGKTTTTRLIAEMLGASGRVVSNDTGANMPAGLVTAMIRELGFDFAVLEVDERYLGSVCEQTRPAAVVLLNLSRDQLDRNPETALVAQAWRRISGDLAPHVIANCDDPNIYWAAHDSPRVTWVSMGDAWHDSWSCPSCGESLSRSAARHWQCHGCGLSRPSPQWSAGEGSATYLPAAQTYELPLHLPGRVNVANAAIALAAAASFGQPAADLARRLSGVRSIAGRYRVIDVFGRQARLLLAKNPASWNEVFQVIDEAAGVLIVLNARELDGRDTSWIWDVDFRRLRGRTVFVSGERRYDLAVRLDVADVEFKIVSSLEEASALAPIGLLDVVANYTAFLELIKEFGSSRQM